MIIKQVVVYYSTAFALHTETYIQDPQMTPHPHRVMFKFGSDRYEGFGTIDTRIALDCNHFIETSVDVVDVDVPLLLGIDFLRTFQIVTDVDRLCLVPEEGWELPLVHRLEYLYINKHKMTSDMLYIDQELRKAHRLSYAPRRFRTSLPKEATVSNCTLRVDLMFLERVDEKLEAAVLHCVDKDTKFNAVRFFPNPKLDTIWKEYQMMSAFPYAGHPYYMHVDQGQQFESRKREELFNLAGIELTLSGIEDHNALGGDERYHAYLKMVY